MDKAKCKEIYNWLMKSHRDLGAARRLLEGGKAYSDIAVYHCQQAAEKAIKGYLTYRDIVFEKTHNLVALLAFCIPLEPKFDRLEEAAEILTPYATEFRYPGDVTEPSKEETQQALAMAENFLNFIIQLLPNEVKQSS